MPGEKIPLAVTAPATRLHSIDAPHGALIATGPNKWTWEAPVKPGLYLAEGEEPGRRHRRRLFRVRHGAEQPSQGRAERYQIGDYPETPLKGNPIYVPPKGFIEVHEGERRHEGIAEFPDQAVPHEAEERLSEISRARRAAGLLTGGDRGASRSRGLGRGRHLRHERLSHAVLQQAARRHEVQPAPVGARGRHLSDKDDNGRMDDFNNDKVVTKEDAVALAKCSRGSRGRPSSRSFIGGIGIYGATAAHGPFVHVDTRPGGPGGESVKLTRRLPSPSSSLTSSSLVTSSTFKSASSTPSIVFVLKARIFVDAEHPAAAQLLERARAFPSWFRFFAKFDPPRPFGGLFGPKLRAGVAAARLAIGAAVGAGGHRRPSAVADRRPSAAAARKIRPRPSADAPRAGALR